MGYYSTLYISDVPINCETQKEMNTRVNKILKMPEFYEIRGYNDLYDIPNSKTTHPRIEHLLYTLTFRGNVLEITPIYDYYDKHYDDAALAFIISKLIAPKGKAYIEYVGEDGQQWGYAIERNKTHFIEYQTLVKINKKKISLNKWLTT